MKENLKRLLARRQKSRIVNVRRVPAAVLLPLYCKEGQYYILFIKRTETVKEHKGQVSFPGGHRSRGDKTLLDTALRESAEEIGLNIEDAEVLGKLDDEVTTTSNYIVSPFVAAVPWPYYFKASQDEVEDIIDVPISALLNKGSLERKTELVDGKVTDAFVYHYQGRVIWGATARILKQFLDIFSQALEESLAADC